MVYQKSNFQILPLRRTQTYLHTSVLTKDVLEAIRIILIMAKRVLFIEEIQSDWAASNRKELNKLAEPDRIRETS